ncbi:MAG: flippase [Nitrospinaceae bacterium]|jgi:O-antigen/teichoic acid export membrane protein|nr:flippase [Nitrospinaceae bacterium]MBT3433754.1 flippase [Nitrospinaceae bacterium]MBT3822568.1 flippase [Nitrospinaceae bacterium]MBT4095444.1 flippase [Nitrospinaceae bacterium]MBT4431149.1 flippase [Nitrospinaceae bacterium]
MSRMAKAAKNSGLIFVGRGVERLVRIAVVVVLARMLGARGFGVYSFAFAFAEVFAIFTDAGIHTVLVREIAKDRDSAPRLLGSALVLKAAMAILAWLAAWVAAIWTIPAGEPLWSALVASFLLFISFRVNSFRMILDAPFEAGLRMKVPVVLGVGSEIFSAACLIAAALAHWPIPALIAVQLVTFLPGCVILAWYFFKEVRPAIRFAPREWAGLLRMAIPIGAANVFLIVYTRSDLLMLEWLAGDFSVGMYSAAYKLTGSLTIIPTAIAMSLLPLISSSFEAGDREKIGEMYRAAISLAMALGLPVAFVGIFLSKSIISVVYGPEFAPSSAAVEILVVVSLLSFMLYVMTTTGVAVGKAGLFTAYAVSLAFLNGILNFILIPRFDFIGASWATLIAEGVMLSAGILVLKPVVGLPSGGAALRAVGCAIIASAPLIWSPAHVLVNLFISAVLYATLIFWGRGVTPEGIEAARSLLEPFLRRLKGNESK